MHILVAPNAFKGSLSALQAAEQIGTGLQFSTLSCTTELFPIADGGDGTVTLLLRQLKGSIMKVFVHDPLGRRIESSFGLIENGRTAVIELADASGIRLLTRSELNPFKTTTFGTGELIKRALDEGVSKIIIGLGGSATVDAGAGILQALGVRFFGPGKKMLDARPECLVDLEVVDVGGIDQRILSCEIVAMCDVDNKLTGEEGAACVFGPQKGATAAEAEVLDEILSRVSKAVFTATGKDMSAVVHGGAAGGAAAGLYAVLNARLEKGADYFLQLTDFETRLKKADIVITGEGSIDEQTLCGKGPFAVACMAKRRDIPVIGVAGKVPLETNPNLKRFFDVLLPIGEGPADLETAMQLTPENLKRTAVEIGDLLSFNQAKNNKQ